MLLPSIRSRTCAFLFKIAFLIVYANAQAAGPIIGLPDNTLRIGLQSGLVYGDLTDPASSEHSTGWLRRTSIVATDWIAGGNRYWLETYFQRGIFSATETRVGQQVEQAGAKFTLHHSLTIFDWFNPWLGAGFDLSFANHVKRYTKDDDNFLRDRFPDRTSIGVGIAISMTNEWTITRDLNIATEIAYNAALSSSVGGTVFNLGFIYRL